MGWKTWPYWLRGGIIVTSLGLLIITIIFALGYKECFIYNNGEGCMGLVLGSALMGAPVFVFLTGVLHIDLVSLSGYTYLHNVFGGGISFEMVYVIFWSIVTNFITGAILGWLIGWIYGKIKSRKK